MLVKTLISRRKSLNLTQEDLSLSSGIALRTIKEIERGKGNPTLATLQELADALGLELTLTIKNLKPHVR